MSEFLNSLNAPDTAPAQSWAAEVAAAKATDAPAVAPEPVAADPAPEPAPATDAAPEPPPPQDEAPEEHDRRVPLKALQEERQKRAEAERRAAEVERKIAELSARFDQVAPKQPEAPPPPDPETDPIGALKYQNEQLRELRTREEQARYEQELNAVAYRAATEFAAQAPDYRDAYQYAINSRAMELRALGTPDHAIPDILHREEMNLIATAHSNGRNPAEAIYQFAKARGFQAPQPAPATMAVAPAPAPVAPQPVAPNPALQQAKAAVAASASSGGAPAAKGELSVAEISNLKGAAFDAAWNKMFGGNKSSIFRE